MKAILLDLDGTLLDLDIHDFLPRYFMALENKVKELVDSKSFVEQLLLATRKMIENTDHTLTNKQVFWHFFWQNKNYQQEKLLALIDDFYKYDFSKLNNNYGPTPGSKQLIKYIQQNDLILILATNPLFPREAIEERLRWASIASDCFDLITSYENMHACKPQVEYYQEILLKMGLNGSDCLMVGNDGLEDMIAKKAGLKTFLVENNIIPHQELQPDYQGLLSEVIPVIKKELQK